MPAKVWALSGMETAAGEWAAPAGTLLDFLLRDQFPKTIFASCNFSAADGTFARVSR